MTTLSTGADEAQIMDGPAPAKKIKKAKVFTLSQIHDSQSKMKNGAGFPAFVQALLSMGVTGYDLYVHDRHADYFGTNGFTIKEEAKYPSFDIAQRVDSEKLASFLKTYQLGKTNYMTFCEQIANAGIEKWTLDVKKLTCTYFDALGQTVFVEKLSVR
jgi:uncharacterized protein YbcV (DUF1398 family)